MSLPIVSELYWPTLKALGALGGSGTIEELNDWITEKLALTDEQLSVTYEKSGALVVPDRCSWARSYLKIAGLADNGGGGVWLITDAGRKALAEGDEQAVKRTVANAYRERAKTYRKGGRQSEGASEEDEPEVDASWTDELLAILKAMPPDAFERLSQRMLREAGFTKVEVTGQSGDGGIDGIGVLRVNLVSFQVLFQCKRWKSSVGAAVVRDFRGAMMGRSDKGLIITTSTFTPDARREATRDGAPAIDLIDGEDLCNLLKELKIGTSVKLVEQVEIDEGVFAKI